MSTKPFRFNPVRRTKRHFSGRDAAAASAMAGRLEEKGFTFREIKERVEAKFGIGAVRYNPHDRTEGNAAARRRRQMERGLLSTNAVRCTCGAELPPGRQAGNLCDACLAAKWG